MHEKPLPHHTYPEYTFRIHKCLNHQPRTSHTGETHAQKNTDPDALPSNTPYLDARLESVLDRQQPNKQPARNKKRNTKHLHQNRHYRRTNKCVERETIDTWPERLFDAQLLSNQPLPGSVRPLLLRFPSSIRNFIDHLFAIFILQRMNTPVDSTIRTDIAVTLHISKADEKTTPWALAIFTSPTPQDENIECYIRNRDNGYHNQPHQIDRCKHAIRPFFYKILC
jgi:hypothetical protein